ncbi:MAG: hypothetical protein LAT63_05965 [Marinobacter sp.]|nr:hypothetical protein [Marinobacter sp.]
MNIKSMVICLASASTALLSAVAGADMTPLDDDTLASISAQSGIYLSGDVSINEFGGPLQNAYFGDCDDEAKRCGARLAFRVKEDGGWLVLDDLRGKFAFEGLTLRIREINDGFAGDGAAFDGHVLEVGLPNIVRYDDVRFTLGASSTARPTDPGFQQTNILNVQMQGNVVLEGNLLLFPTGNP